MTGRTKPYTAIGIKRLKCFRCGSPAQCQWQICSDGNVYRLLCLPCDLALNDMVLRWMGFPDVEAKMAAYKGAGAA